MQEKINPGMKEVKKRKRVSNGLLPTLDDRDGIEDQDRKVFLVPVFGYENYQVTSTLPLGML